MHGAGEEAVAPTAAAAPALAELFISAWRLLDSASATLTAWLRTCAWAWGHGRVGMGAWAWARAHGRVVHAGMGMVCPGTHRALDCLETREERHSLACNQLMKHAIS